jgi:Tfp pilus assembly PilM family ATPase
MSSKNNSAENRYIGMEIDDYEVRVVELEFSSAMPKLCKAGRIKLEQGTVVEGIVKNPGALASKLVNLWSNSNLISDKILLGISNKDILIRFAKVAKMDDIKIKNIIRFQSQEYFPVSINDYEMDFMTLHEKTDENNNEVKEIVIVASKNSHIRAYTTALEAAKLCPYEIDITSLSIMKFAEHLDPNCTSILVNITYGKIDLLILKNSIPIFAQTSLFDPGSILNEESNTSTPAPAPTPTPTPTSNPTPISLETNENENSPSIKENITSDTLENITSDTLENIFSISLAQDYNFSKSETVSEVEYSMPSEVENPVFNVILTEIKSIINYCLSLSDSEHPSNIVLCGPCSSLEGLDDHISTQTMIKTIILEPFKDIYVPDNIKDEIGIHSADFAVCTCLALRGSEV